MRPHTLIIFLSFITCFCKAQTTYFDLSTALAPFDNNHVVKNGYYIQNQFIALQTGTYQSQNIGYEQLDYDEFSSWLRIGIDDVGLSTSNLESLDSKISIAPNPLASSQHVHISSSDAQSQMHSITLMDANGRRIEEFMPDEYVYELETKDYPNGIYFLKILLDNHTMVSKKFMISR